MSPLQTHLQTLLANRQYPKTICPSEAARALSSRELQELRASEWRDVMPAVRELVWQMRARGEVEVLQHGAVLGPEVERLEDVTGPIRVRRVDGDGETETRQD